MTKEQNKQFYAIIAAYGKTTEDKINGDTRFRDDLNLSSLDFMAFLGEIEDTFDVEIEEERAAELATVDEAVRYLDELLEEA